MKSFIFLFHERLSPLAIYIPIGRQQNIWCYSHKSYLGFPDIFMSCCLLCCNHFIQRTCIEKTDQADNQVEMLKKSTCWKTNLMMKRWVQHCLIMGFLYRIPELSLDKLSLGSWGKRYIRVIRVFDTFLCREGVRFPQWSLVGYFK